ncbi:MAG: 1-acyl-sn-glycerol-3-phosphate acyltransferase [Myxococcales bacterium]|nr:1-acyl-sn-glycerol-3-phosphate acyltransferase [Myxococcales bacterium]
MYDSVPPGAGPSAVQRLVNRWFFDNIQISDDWTDSVRLLAAQGTVVYVLRNLNAIDYLALDHLTQRCELPPIGFVNDLRLGPLLPQRKSRLSLPALRSKPNQAAALRSALERGESAAIFLRRPPGMIDLAAGATGGRGLSDGDEIVRTLIALQQRSERPILLVPQIIIWTARPDTQGTHWADMFFGPREWPSPVRTLGQLLYNYKHVALRTGEPLNLRDYLSRHAHSNHEHQIRRLVYTMLRRLERERRTATGPALKPPDRLRLQVLRSPQLQAVITGMAGEREEDQQALSQRALKTLRSLQAMPDTATVKGLEVLLDRVFNRIYAGIDVDWQGLDRLRDYAREGTLVLLPSHKSHVDYLVLSFLFNDNNLQLPMIAAGDNLSFFPLGPILRRAGAFFIRRSFRGDKLYAATLEAYVRRLLRDGHTIEVFLEGGRSRTGKLLKPRMGLLNMLVDAASAIASRQVYFIPISIGYERVVEAQAYEHELSGGEKAREDAASLFKSTEVLQHRYGRINVQFGQALTLQDLQVDLGLGSGLLVEAQQRALVTRLGNRTMDEINRVTAVTPGALTALAVLSDRRRSVEHEELMLRCRRLLEVLIAAGARITPRTATAGRLRQESIREALQLFVDAELLEAHAPGDDLSGHERRSHRTGQGVLYRVPERTRIELDATKNHIVHFFVERGLVAIAALMPPALPTPVSVVRDRVLQLSQIFKHEFRFRADATFDTIFQDTLEQMATDGELVQNDDELALGGGRCDWGAHVWLRTYASILKNFVESYRIAARGLGALVRGPLAEKELTKKTLALGNRMFLADEVEMREAINKSTIQNALEAFSDEGYIRRDNGKYALTKSFSSEAAVRAIEGRIASYLEMTSERS